MVKAIAVLKGDSPVKGIITFTQGRSLSSGRSSLGADRFLAENESSPVTVSGEISGMDPNAQRGFHIHSFGDNSCVNSGLARFRSPLTPIGSQERLHLGRTSLQPPQQERTLLDPHAVVDGADALWKQHGGPTDSERHAGDLGNIQTDASGNVKINITDKHISSAPALISSPERLLNFVLEQAYWSFEHHRPFGRRSRRDRRSRQGRQRRVAQDRQRRRPRSRAYPSPAQLGLTLTCRLYAVRCHRHPSLNVNPNVTKRRKQTEQSEVKRGLRKQGEVSRKHGGAIGA